MNAGFTRDPMTQATFDWRTITALNSVSTLSQVGQFGFTFVMLPVWLASQGLTAAQLGLFAASLWLGQLPGLALAPRLSHRFGPRKVIVAGLLATVLALAGIALMPWPFLLPAGLIAGLGLGLRWIGLEPWLYEIAPAHARGRLVGFHETLIALAPIVAPLLAGFFGVEGRAVFFLGIGFTLSALLPLAFSRKPPIDGAESNPGTVPLKRLIGERVFLQGLVIGLVGGLMEAALSGLFAVFTQSRGLSLDQTADLLAAFGLGGLLLQYPVGWLADHRGLGTAGVACALASALCTWMLGLPLPFGAMLGTLFFLGGFVTGFLTLALIAATTTPCGAMAKNVSLISMTYTLSAALGPLLAGAAIHQWGAQALMSFASIAALAMVIGLMAIPRKARISL